MRKRSPPSLAALQMLKMSKRNHPEQMRKMRKSSVKCSE
jgi:hypothetical protein